MSNVTFDKQVSETHRESVGYRPSMPCHLRYWCVGSRAYPYVLAMRTFHYNLHLIDQAVDNVESLRSGRL
jgi:hypothetical protein